MGIKGVNFIVVDVETTGSHPDKNRLTEIACVVVRDGEIRDKFTSLVNPHQFIPQYIANMTGISNEMAFRAPEAADVLPQARKYFELENSIFVAHNVKFDWGFVQSSLKRVKLPEIDIPMLVVQGENDPRVPVTESEQVVEALRKEGKTVWYMNALNEGHGFRKKENSDVSQQVTLMFFEKYL